MSNYLIETNKDYPFDKIKLHTQQPIQGGTYLAKISLMDRLEKCEDKQSLLDNEIHAIRDEVLELEARRLNAINKQSQR